MTERETPTDNDDRVFVDLCAAAALFATEGLRQSGSPLVRQALEDGGRLFVQLELCEQPVARLILVDSAGTQLELCRMEPPKH